MHNNETIMSDQLFEYFLNNHQVVTPSQSAYLHALIIALVPYHYNFIWKNAITKTKVREMPLELRPTSTDAIFSS
jgi:hypothetical protein